MNGPFQVAQASGAGITDTNSNTAPRIFRLTKPLGDQAVVINLGYDQKVKVDLSGIANEKITLVHVGEKLIVLFDNKSTVTVEPFFDSRHDALNNLSIEVAPGREVSVNEFASLFPITTDQSVLPAAGDGAGNAQASGAYFSDSSVDPLPGNTPLGLLGQEELGNFAAGGEQFLTVPAPTIVVIGAKELVVDESFIPGAGSLQAPAGSNVHTVNFADVFQSSGGVTTYALHIDNAATGLVDSQTGQPVMLVQNGNGEVDGIVTVGNQQFTVFTLTLDASGHLTFTELRAVHESDPNNFNEGTTLGAGRISLVATVTDGFGQTASASLDLGPHMTIHDDGPSIEVAGREEGEGAPSLSVDESFLTTNTNYVDGTLAPHPHEPVTDFANFSGAFKWVPGADTATVTYALGVKMTQGESGSGDPDSGLVDSQTGDPVYLHLVGDNKIEGRVGGDPGKLAFRIELDTQTGKVTLTDLRAVHELNPHDPNEPINLDRVENLVTLTATITDKDGDSDSATIDLGAQITFYDDGPTLTVTAPAAINGLDFGDFVLNNNAWGTGSGVATGTNGGWTIGDANAGYQPGDQIGNTGGGAVQLERVGDGYEGMHSSTHGFMVDLDASPHDLKISQTLTGLVDGQTYDLRFEAGAPFPNSAHLEVWFGGVRVGNISPTGQMQEYMITLTGGSGDHSNLLEFRETGTPDNQGTYLANVSVGTIVIDETPGFQANEVVPNSLFDAIVHGIDPDMPAAQFATGKAPVVTVAANFGADGPQGTAYSLFTTNDTDSGLTTTAGQAIHLFNETYNNGVHYVVGRYDSDGVNGITSADDAAFAFTVDPTTGALSLVQYVSLQHPNTSSNDEGLFLNTGALSVKVTITDRDGDTATQSADISANIRFDDDGPHATEATILAGEVFEDGLLTGNPEGAPGSQPTQITITQSDLAALVNFGADGPGAFGFNPAAEGQNTGLTQLTQPITWHVVNANEIDGVVNGDPSKVVFTLVKNGADFTFTLVGNVDHLPLNSGGGDSETLTVNLASVFTATDGDGDTVVLTGGVNVVIENDIPKIAAAPLDQIVNGDFSHGDWSTPDWWGSVSYDVTGWTLAASPVGPGAVDLERAPDGLYNLHSSTHGPMVDLGSSPGNTQITQTFGASGNAGALVSGQTYAIQFEAGAPFPGTAKLEVLWNGEVIGTIDPSGPGALTSYNYIVTADGTSDKLTFREIGTGNAPIPGDYNGHSYQTEGFHGTYLANVKLVATYVVDEDGLPAGNHDLPAPSQGDAPGLATSVNGSLGISWGADKYDSPTPDTADTDRFYQDNNGGVLTGRHVVFTDANIGVSGGTDSHSLTSHGDAVVLSLSPDGTVLIGTATHANVTRVVFEVSLSDDGTGAFKFTLKDALDQAPNGSENDLNLTFNFTAVDSDGDTAKGTFTVGVDDDVPVATGATINVDGVFEDGLLTGNPEGAPGSQPTQIPITQDDLAALVNFGADGPGVFGFNPAAEGTSTGLFSDGSPISYHIQGDTLSGVTADNRTIFTVVDNHAGGFVFTLLGNVDHLPLDGGGGDSEKLTLNLASVFTATDGDGDTVVLTGGVNVVIENDIPVVTTNSNLIMNGSFEDGHADLGEGQWAIYHSLPGWTTADIGPTGPAGDVPFEVQTGGVGGVPAEDGNALVELDSDQASGNLSGGDHFNDSGHTNAIIQQVVHGTEAGHTYELTFWYSPRPGEGNADSGSMNVLWNGNVVKSIDSTGMTPGVWQQITVFVEGTGPDNVLGFQGTGQENSLGAYIDNVSLVAMGVVDEDGLPSGNHDSQPGDIAVPNVDGDNNEATTTGQLDIKWGADNFNGGADTHVGGDPAKGFVQDTSGRSVTFTNDNVGITGGLLTSHGDAVTLTLSADHTVLTATAGTGENTRTVFEASLSDDGTGQYRFILKDALDHAPGQNENNLILSFNYTATDSDGDSVPGTFQVLVDDDVPLANNDMDVVDSANFMQATGNVITGAGTSVPLSGADKVGADGASVTLITGSGGAGVGTYGTITIDSAGNYVYTAKGVPVPSGATDVFTYTLTDGDGDTSTATLTIGYPTVPAPTVTVGANNCLPEDTQEAIQFTATPQDANSHITQITVSGLTGWTVDTNLAHITASGGGSVTGATFVAGVLTLTLSGAPAGAAETVAVNMKPPLNSDVDAHVTMTATAAEGPISVISAGTAGTIYVDAVADTPTPVSGQSHIIFVSDSNDADSAFKNGETGTLQVKAVFGDAHDGSEAHKLHVQLESGFTAGLSASGTINGSYNGAATSFSYTYNSATGVVDITVPSDAGHNPQANQTATVDLSFNVTAPAGGKLPATLDFTVTATATENPTDLGCGPLPNHTDVSADNTASLLDTASIAGVQPLPLTGTLTTNTNSTPQDIILTFVDQEHPLDAFSQLLVRAGQGQQTGIVGDNGFNISANDQYQVALEAAPTTTTNVKITDFYLNGVELDTGGNHSINSDLQGGRPEALIAVIPGVGSPVPFNGSTNDSAAGGHTLTDNSSSYKYLYGADGNDNLNASGATGTKILNGGAGADSVTGGSGNDILVYHAADTLLDGGAGFDILRIDDGAIYNASLAAQGGGPNGGFANAIVDLNGHNIKNIESILLTEEPVPNANLGTELHGLSVNNVIDFTSATNSFSQTAHSLFIVGSSGDDVQLTTGAGGWTETGNTFVSAGGQLFHQWVATNGGGATASLFIDNDLQVNHAAQ